MKAAGMVVPLRPPGASTESSPGLLMKMTPAAPASAAFWTLMAKVQVPRSIRVKAPAKELVGSGAQAWETASANRTGNPTDVNGPAPWRERNVPRPRTVREFDQVWELVV